jgi:hypothetical protein
VTPYSTLQVFYLYHDKPGSYEQILFYTKNKWNLQKTFFVVFSTMFSREKNMKRISKFRTISEDKQNRGRLSWFQPKSRTGAFGIAILGNSGRNASRSLLLVSFKWGLTTYQPVEMK